MRTTINRPDVAIIVLTRNAGELWPAWIRGIKQQNVQAGRYLVLDSSSTDATVSLALEAGLEVYSIDHRRFDHGGTRQLAADLCPDADYLVYLTQDAILEQPDSLEQLLKPLTDGQVAMVYGRHVAHDFASLIEKHARAYTYPTRSTRRTLRDMEQLGFRAAFSSDVYAAYRVSALRSIGGFPSHVIVSEDSYVSARLLLAGWTTVYSADSRVRHSHHYSLLHIFRRYFDVGVFHATEKALLQRVGRPDKEAGAYVRSLIRFLNQHNRLLLPLAALQTLTKLLGFRLGQRHAWLPGLLCRLISLQRAYWLQEKPVSGAVPIWLAMGNQVRQVQRQPVLPAMDRDTAQTVAGKKALSGMIS
ncbi:MAG TPA: glycosyltransferase [Thiolinea sp.]|nr:glycosyltransferase [Thiolinea sp.]